MSKQTRNVVLLAMLQPVANVAVVPTGAANAMMAMNISAQPVSAEFAKRNNLRPYFGNAGSVQVAVHSEISFDVELAGSGTPGAAPAYGPLLRACAFSETITVGTSVVYAPVTNGLEFVTMYYNLDGTLFKMTDAKGTVSLDITAKGIPVLKFKFIGLFVAPKDDPLPVNVDYSRFRDPVAVNKENTPTALLHGFAGAVQSISVDIAGDVKYVNRINKEAVNMSGRTPTGTFVMELVSLAEKDWFTTIQKGTLGELRVVHGKVAGNIVELSAPKVQLLEPSFSDSEGIAMLSTKLELQPDVGNDEFILTVR